MQETEFDEPPEDDAGAEGTWLLGIVSAEQAGMRLDVAATELARVHDPSLSRTRLKKLIETGGVTVAGDALTEPSSKVEAGQEVAIYLPLAEDALPQGEALPLDVVFEDDHLIVIDKPAGLVVHPAPGHASGTLVNALIAHCGASLSGIGGVRRPGIVHRLDKDTSGLLVVAKTDAAHQGLAALFADHGRTLPLERTYTAFVWGQPSRPHGVVDAPIGRHPTDRLRMAVVPERRGRSAITHWRIEETFGPTEPAVASLVACDLETGRTHQIRVHMAHIGHPVLGDPLYAKGFLTKAAKLSEPAQGALAQLHRQALHAARLGFEHPVTRQLLSFESALPADLAKLRDALQL